MTKPRMLCAPAGFLLLCTAIAHDRPIKAAIAVLALVVVLVGWARDAGSSPP